MEVPMINRISDFDGGINPSIIAQAFANSGIETIYQAYSVWKWSAVMVALLVASFTPIVSRIRILLIRFQNGRPISTALLIQEESDYDTESEPDSEFSDDEESTDGDSGEEEEEVDFRVRGSAELVRRSGSIGDFFSWPEFSNGTTSSVVKLWDNLGLGLELNFNGEEETFFAGTAAGEVSVSAETNMAGNFLRVWDSRVGCRIPQILAEWRPKLGKIIGVDAGGLTVAADMRKAPVVGSVTGM